MISRVIFYEHSVEKLHIVFYTQVYKFLFSNQLLLRKRKHYMDVKHNIVYTVWLGFYTLTISVRAIPFEGKINELFCLEYTTNLTY